MKQLWYSFRFAVSMYCVIPLGKIERTKENMKYVLCFVPLVGALIAGLVSEWGTIHPYLLNYEFLRSVVCVLLSLFLSGGAHIDGFFRTVDAMSSHKNRTGKLNILQDSHSGYTAIFIGVGYFLLLVGLWSELPIEGWTVVAMGFILSRVLYGLSIVWFPHTQESKGSFLVPEGKAKPVVTIILLAYLVFCIVFMLWLNPSVGAGCLVGALLAFLYYIWVAFRHFGGITEDVASFFVMVCEIAIPLVALLVYRMPMDWSEI